MLKSSNISKYFLILSILSLIVVCLVIYNISLNNYMKPINDAKSNELIKQFDPKLDMETIKEIVNREDLTK